MSDVDLKREETLRAALAHEQQNSKKNEQLIKQLQLDLEAEKSKTRMLTSQVDQLRQASVQIQVSAEQQEEFISNTLLRRISDLKKEKESLLVQVEQEEEYMTNTLSKKVSQLLAEKRALEVTLEEERDQMVTKLQTQLSKLMSNNGSEQSSQLAPLETMAEQLRHWQHKYTQLEKSRISECDLLREEVRQLRTENFILRQNLLRESEKLESLASKRIRSTSSVPEELKNIGQSSSSNAISPSPKPSSSAGQPEEHSATHRRSRSGPVHSPVASSHQIKTISEPSYQL